MGIILPSSRRNPHHQFLLVSEIIPVGFPRSADLVALSFNLDKVKTAIGHQDQLPQRRFLPVQIAPHEKQSQSLQRGIPRAARVLVSDGKFMDI